MADAMLAPPHLQDLPGGNYIESLLMTDSGLEILSKLDRRLTVL